MTFRFGFELEGFYVVHGDVLLPPTNYPTDGFPGLCEARSNGGQTLHSAYFDMLEQLARFPFTSDLHEFTFSPAMKQKIRARHNEKTAVHMQNIYGKPPRALGNRTLASLQINISNEIKPAYTDDKGVRHLAVYGLFDYVPIIRALDEEFAPDIAASHRQPGWYAIKDELRMEYRSLPNFVATTDITKIDKFLKRIERCVK